MGYTRTWSDLIGVTGTLLKGMPLTALNTQVCDFISNDMYLEYPWKDTITTIATGTIPLLDGVQDYDSPINIYRLTRAMLVRYDTTPVQFRDLDIVDDNAPNLDPRSYVSIRSCSQQQATGTLRLESAVQVPTGTLLELQGEYQLNPTKIAALNQGLWFKDQYAQVALEGLMYWAYKLSDDTRAGTVQTDAQGRATAYTGQLAIYKAALYRMKMAEDWGTENGLFPESTMGLGRDMNALYIFGGGPS